MPTDLCALLSMPAAERLALAEILRGSVGCPADIETLQLPAWQLDRLERLLRQCPDPPGVPPG
jgi:hypothetical protein